MLEHVTDDAQAMRELRRVLAPGGWAAVMVPIDATLERTYEDPSIVDPAERERAFLQHDHVRLYGPDIADRLEAAGLEVDAQSFGDLGGGAVATHGLLADETVFCASRPGG